MMGNSVRLFSIAGFEVKIHVSWIIIAMLLSWSLAAGFFPARYPGLGATDYWLMGIAGVLGLFMSIIAHEVMHSVIARKHEMQMKGITLFIFGGIAELGEEPPNAKSEFQVAIIGPITSGVIAGAFYGLHSIAVSLGWPTVVTGALFYLALINGVLAIFNLVPAYPLDGGRVLRAFFWHRRGNLRDATRIASGVGSGFSFILMFLGLLNIFGGNIVGGMWWILIGMFLNSASAMSRQQVEIRSALIGEPIERFMNKDPISVNPSVSIREFVDDYVYRHHFKMFPVIDDSKLLGCITTKEVKEIPREKWDRTTVGEAAHGCSEENAISTNIDAVEVLNIMNRTGRSRLLVRDGNRLVGIVSLKDMLEFLSVKLDLEGEDIDRDELKRAA